MPAEARIASVWKKQKFFVSLMLIAFGAWFFFDGLVGYPRANKRYDKWKSFHLHLEEGKDKDQKAKLVWNDLPDEAGWNAVADQNNWKRNEWREFLAEHHQTANPPEDAYDSGKIYGQYAFGSLTAGVGLIILIYWATQIRRVLRTDDEAVYTPAGTRVPFGAITGVGKKKWDSKGIAKVRYELDGKSGEFVVDDYKFEAEPTRKILAEIEEKLLAQTPQTPQT